MTLRKNYPNSTRYYNEFDDKISARKYINAGIALVKKTYSKAEIEKFVNGTNFEISDFQPVGKTNTIRELYVLKSDIENLSPTFKSEARMEGVEGWKILCTDANTA